MTKKEALTDFKRDIYPLIIKSYGVKDKVALAEAWNNYTDSLCKEGLITQKQYNNWENPF